MAEGERLAVRLLVTGRVQGVFFRDWTVGEARAAGLAGWVRNRRDSSVEIAVAGPVAIVERFVEACGQGPERARVEAVSREPVGEDDLPLPFERRPGA